MSIRSKLFATVALPVFVASLAVQPALADSLMAPFEVAQEGTEQPSPEDLLLLKKRKQRAAEEESQGQAQEQQPQAEEQQAPRRKKRQQQAEEQQPATEESAPQQAEEQAPRRKKRQQQAEEQQPAAEEAAPQQAEEQAPRRKKRQQQAEEQQPAAEESAPQQAEEQAPRRKKRQQQAEEQQPAAEESAPQQAEEQETPRRKKRQQQAEEQQPAAEESAPQQAEEQAPTRKKRQQQAEEQQPAAEESAPQQAEEQAPTRKKRQQQAEEQRQTDEQKAAQQPAVVPEGGTTAEQPATEAPAQQTGEGEQQPVPGAEQPATAEGEQPQGQPAPEVVDERTTEEKQKVAEDPAASDDTVVLPVERGAAVLDSDKDADNAGGNQSRQARRKQREELRAKQESVAAPTDDASAQAQAAIPVESKEELSQRIEAVLKEEGERVEEAPAFAVPETTNIVNNTVINNTVINNTTVNNVTENNVTEVQVVEQVDDRVILGVGDRIFVRGDDRPRLRQNSEESYYDNLSGGRVRETIVRPGGYQIITVYNRYGDILTRTRVDRNGDEYVMMYTPEYEDDRPAIVDVGYELPPMRLGIPVDEYIVDVAEDPDRDYYEFLSEPPVEQVERVYTIDEVRNSARLRDKVRRIDLDTIEFATGSAEVSMTQAKTLRNVADAMSKVLEKDPGETFFIEGHTDAVGSDRSNLVLSDERAESVAVLLTEVYGVPAENLVTQGYGERFLKIRTPEAEQENRRVTIRRVTPLVRPVAQR
ncbi:Outer membrane protein A Outer membrane protein II*; Flags: Precursor [Sinorhizobium fredii HH103]|uniref:OmpA-like domain-containing protein n=1 Tax=Sinorhizobium fredii (strain HH103) TaxID=1117943 RepID=G9A764_SINF1|nr:OmpA family protein [Sinorhizobium fredii]CCE96094.1 Outer membrane protein A Outer membrane protein II*; Flags: Precursor [Sinorhizobium fredii HH103]